MGGIVFADANHTQSNWLTGPSLPEKLDFSQTFEQTDQQFQECPMQSQGDPGMCSVNTV